MLMLFLEARVFLGRNEKIHFSLFVPPEEGGETVRVFEVFQSEIGVEGGDHGHPAGNTGHQGKWEVRGKGPQS